MFKRSTKITSLLVVAASVASMVPAYAADVKRIESKDGQVYSAQAYKDGIAVIDGDAKDNDNDAVYYLKDGEYTELDDVDTGDDFDGVTAEKYLDTDDGDNYVDLTTGKVTDDDIKSDNADDAASALKKKVKADNDGRYAKGSNSYGYGSDETPDLTESNIVAGNQYGETYYAVKYAAKDADEAGTNYYNVFTNGEGKYIDADYNIGKIKVTTAKGSLTLKNTDADEITSEDDTKATITSGGQVIAQDKDYIYRISTIKVTCTSGDITEINGADCTTGSAVFTSVNNGYEFKAIQKISKAQSSDDIDGIKYANKVDTYIISDEDADGLSGDEATLLSGDTSNISYTVVNGKLIAYSTDKDSPLVATITLKSKSSYYYTDVADVNDDDTEALDVDVDGNLWRLDDGYVYEWDNDEDWNKVYKVDGAMSHFSVYDKDNMVIWSDEDDDDEVFSVISSKTKAEETEVPATTTQVGWVQNTTDGSYTYYKEDGTQVKNNWIQSSASGLWYFMNTDGIMMQNGWLQNGGVWYYLSETGAMKTGWIQLSGTWYYLNPVSGGPLGAMKTGWFKDTSGTWYYANESGAMLHDTTVGGYKLGSSGAWIQ